MGKNYLSAGRVDMRYKGSSYGQSNAPKRNRSFNKGLKKREEELLLHADGKNVSATGVKELSEVDEKSGYISYKDLGIKSMERREDH